MLNAFICDDGQLRRLDEPATADALRPTVWIDLLRPTEQELDRVRQATGLEAPTAAALQEIEISSRLATRQGVLYLSLPLVAQENDGARGVDAGFVLSRDRLITVRFSASRVFDTYAEQLPRGDAPHEIGAHIMVGLFEALVDRQADVLEQVRAQLDTLSHRIFALGAGPGGGRKDEDAILRATLGELGQIGDLISHVRDTQVNAARVVPYVESMTAEWLPEALTPRLRTLRQDIASISEFETYLNNKLQFLLDATLGFINIAQNNVMKVLTIASVVGIPPVLVAGIYGMNFKTIPEYDWAWGYAWGLAMIVITALTPLAIFRWRKWL